MNSAVTTFSRKSVTRALAVALLAALLVSAPMAVRGQEGHDHSGSSPAKLVQIVRESTQQFVDVNAAGPAGYSPTFGCVSGPDHGAMGVHFINGALVGDGQVDATHPEALIYEPVGDKFRLVGVEYVVFVDAWNANHSAPPTLEGQAFNIVGSPNRYGLPPFYELHVWAWRDNPQGAFVDWNNKVTCEKQSQ